MLCNIRTLNRIDHKINNIQFYNLIKEHKIFLSITELHKTFIL